MTTNRPPRGATQKCTSGGASGRCEAQPWKPPLQNTHKQDGSRQPPHSAKREVLAVNESARPDQPRQRRHRTSLTGTAEPEASTTTHRLDAWIMVDRWRERRDAGRRCQNTCQIAVGSNVVPHRHTTLARIPAWRRLLSVEREAMSTTGRFSFAHTTRACDIAVAHG